MTRPQKGKGGKRRKQWHRGKGEARVWDRSALPDVGTDADTTNPTPPRPSTRGPGKKWRGDAA